MALYANENITFIESVMDKFNAILVNKKLLVLNELQSIYCNKYLNSDALKFALTVKRIYIKQMNKPERLCENVTNFMMVSNNEIPIKIESTDRRYMVTKTSDKKEEILIILTIYGIHLHLNLIKIFYVLYDVRCKKF